MGKNEWDRSSPWPQKFRINLRKLKLTEQKKNRNNSTKTLDRAAIFWVHSRNFLYRLTFWWNSICLLKNVLKTLFSSEACSAWKWLISANSEYETTSVRLEASCNCGASILPSDVRRSQSLRFCNAPCNETCKITSNY